MAWCLHNDAESFSWRNFRIFKMHLRFHEELFMDYSRFYNIHSFQNLKQHFDRQIKWRIDSTSEIISNHCGGMLSAKNTLIWQPADDLRKTRMVIFPHSNICRGLSCVVSVLCRPQYCELSISCPNMINSALQAKN